MHLAPRLISFRISVYTDQPQFEATENWNG